MPFPCSVLVCCANSPAKPSQFRWCCCFRRRFCFAKREGNKRGKIQKTAVFCETSSLASDVTILDVLKALGGCSFNQKALAKLRSAFAPRKQPASPSWSWQISLNQSQDLPGPGDVARQQGAESISILRRALGQRR